MSVIDADDVVFVQPASCSRDVHVFIIGVHVYISCYRDSSEKIIICNYQYVMDIADKVEFWCLLIIVCIVNLCIFWYFKNDLLDLFLAVCKVET